LEHASPQRRRPSERLILHVRSIHTLSEENERAGIGMDNSGRRTGKLMRALVSGDGTLGLKSLPIYETMALHQNGESGEKSKRACQSKERGGPSSSRKKMTTGREGQRSIQNIQSKRQARQLSARSTSATSQQTSLEAASLNSETIETTSTLKNGMNTKMAPSTRRSYSTMATARELSRSSARS